MLLFLEGATGFRQMNAFQVEHLVSHGYIVVAIDQPGAAAAVVFPDGRHAVGLTVPQFHATVRPSYMPVQTNSPPTGVQLPNGSTLTGNSIIPYLAQDVSFTLDQLAALNLADPHGVLPGKLDLQRVGVFGVSLGGIVAGQACHVDARLRAFLVMDAPMSIDVVKAGLQQPGMWITRDAASMRLERQRSGGWPEAEIEAHQTSMRAAYQGLSGAGYFVRVPGMFHSNFTDAAIWTPLAPWLGFAGPIGARRAHDIVNAYSLAFFDRHLLGRPATLLDGAANNYPEVRFESRRYWPAKRHGTPSFPARRRPRSLATLISRGMKVPMHMAASTSDGQWTPSTRRETATRPVHVTASNIAKLPARGQSRATHNAAAVENAAVVRVCPLGKLEPQYHCASHNAGRARPTMAFITQTTSVAAIGDAPTSTASKRRRATTSATAATTATGTRNRADPLNVNAAKKPFSAAGTCSRTNHRMASSTGPDSFATTSSMSLIPPTARVSSPRTANRRFVRCSVHCGLCRRA